MTPATGILQDHGENFIWKFVNRHRGEEWFRPRLMGKLVLEALGLRCRCEYPRHDSLGSGKYIAAGLRS